MSDHTNRFTGLSSWCPRCGQTVHVEKFIVNFIKDNSVIMATYACPACSDVVQIVVAQESAENVAPRRTGIETPNVGHLPKK